MFYKHSREGKIVVLIVYVDDMSLTDHDSRELDKLKKALNREFEIKDFGFLIYFLGIEFISQRKYILVLLGETGLLGYKVAETPI